MKKCPTCQSVYTDESLKFCLNDGATLFIPQTEEATQSFNQPIHTNQPINIPIANQTVETQFRPMAQPVQQTSGGGKGLLFAVIGGLAVLLILGAVGLVGWFLMNSKKDDTVATVTNKNASPTATITPTINNSPTPTPDETANLKQKLAELEKKMQQQKQSGKNNVPITTDGSQTATPKPSVVTAKANSPGDGFLALRSSPSAVTGDRIMKIPHGATLKVLSCLKPAPGKTGRWCRVDYEGNSGWAFDGFMTY